MEEVQVLLVMEGLVLLVLQLVPEVPVVPVVQLMLEGSQVR